MMLFFKLIILLAIGTMGGAIYISHSYNKYINTAPDSMRTVKVIVIRHGESIPKIISKLSAGGVIVDGKRFYYYAKLHRKLTQIKYGEYEFTTSMTPAEVLDKLVRGDIKKYKITIPEGFNMYQVAGVIYDELLIDKDEFIVRCLSGDFAKEVGIDAPSLEGYLFPDTYYFTKSMTIDDILLKMVWNYRLNYTQEMKARTAELNMTEHDIVTLASIIEKETSLGTEMPVISAVFHNRLKKNMRLQSDPTVIYGIPDFDGNITKADLLAVTPYNTYKIYGLPPTPIANPGHKALTAALYPDDVPYLYFVSKNNGSHYFSKDFDEHKRAVYKYQVKLEKAVE